MIASVPLPSLLSIPLPLIPPLIVNVSAGFATVMSVLLARTTGAAISWLPLPTLIAAIVPLTCIVNAFDPLTR